MTKYTLIMKKIITLALATSLCIQLFAENEKRMIVISTDRNTIEEFKAIASFGHEIGATHMNCGQVEPSIWQWDINRYDPYTNWSLKNATLFKYVVPEQLKPYLPADYAERNLAMLKQKGAILKKNGMLGYMHFMDPAFLPEQVYRDHPEWRGPRCDQARRSRSEYYAPCIDNKETRGMFVESFAKLCKVFPVEYLSILCGDSGSGLCWYEHLYPGANGPEACKATKVEDRVLDFMDMWQEGAAKAGVKTKVNVNHVYDMESILPRMKEGQYLLGKTASESQKVQAVGMAWYGDTFFPVSQLTNMVRTCEQLQAALDGSLNPISITITGSQQEDMMRLVKLAFKQPLEAGPLGRAKAMNQVAASFVGQANAEKLTEIWDQMDRIDYMIRPFNTGGLIYALGTVHQRWLTRPFVAFPEELKGDDLHYWRDFIFQAQEEEKAYDMLDLQAHRWLDGYGGHFLLKNTSRRMLTFLEPCIKSATALKGCAVDKAAERYLYGLELRLKLYRCIIKNGMNAVEFQWIMDSADKTKKPVDHSLFIRWQGDDELVRIKQITRDEIDNCFAVIALLDEAEKAGIKILETEQKPEWENILFLAPDIREQLRHKVRIMEDHRMDFLRIWKTKNL